MVNHKKAKITNQNLPQMQSKIRIFIFSHSGDQYVSQIFYWFRILQRPVIDAASQLLYRIWEIIVGQPRISVRKIDYFVLFQKWQDLSFVMTNLNKKKNGDLLEAKEKVKSGPCGPAYITLILHRNKKKQGLVLDKLYTQYTINLRPRYWYFCQRFKSSI